MKGPRPTTPPPIPPAATRSRAVGIDFGTTNSVIAVIDRDGAPRILTTEEGSTTLPSLVWFSPDGPVVGERARDGLDHSPDMTILGAEAAARPAL